MRTAVPALLIVAVCAGCPTPAAAQAEHALGTRAQGMAGAFVGVADDASAVYWNPAGLASGAYFSLVLDGGTGQAVPDDEPVAGSRSGWLLALSMPALGLSYYRQELDLAEPADEADGAFRLDSLVTQHVGATFVQSLTGTLAVGATIKLVRGLAGTADVPAADAEAALDDWDVRGKSTSRLGVDVGIMAAGSFGRLGVVVRNATEPAFETGSGRELTLERQIRAGASMPLLPAWLVAADVDLTRTRSALGEVRELALGTEGQVTRRVAARAGVRLNTAGDHGRTPALAVGGSVAVSGALLLDAQWTGGSERAFRGWGMGGRVVF